MTEMQMLSLEKLKIGLRIALSEALLRDVRVEQWQDYSMRQIITMVEAYLWSNTIHTERETYQHTASWWQGFKASFFPPWLLRRFPVRMTSVTCETKFIHVCPHLNITAPNEERFHLQWLKEPPRRP